MCGYQVALQVSGQLVAASRESFWTMFLPQQPASGLECVGHADFTVILEMNVRNVR